MEDSTSAAAAALDGTSSKCQLAQKVYFEKMRPLALKIPDKLKNVEASLSNYKTELGKWTDTIAPNRGGSVSASAQAASPF